MYSILSSTLTILVVIISCASLVSCNVPELSAMKTLLRVYFPNLNENTTIYSFLSDEKNVELLDKVHLHSCIDLKRKRKIRSLDWLWTSTTFSLPPVYTLNETAEQEFSHEGRFYNPYAPAVKNVTKSPDNVVNVVSGDNETTTESGKTEWPTNAVGERIPKQHMKALDYINMINNDMDAERDAAGAGGCPLGFGRN
uniref:Uncharacterized protein n=1 Tax=Cacopsylla melanoneura TaxID=428564 RepID=A0A8D8PPI9_9HEMI